MAGWVSVESKMIKIRQFREFRSEIKAGQAERFVFLNAWVRTKQRDRLRDSLKTGCLLEILTPRPVL